MPIYQGQNYKVNRKVKEAVDKNQVNYRESADSSISIIKRVYVYITDKRGNVLPEVTVTIDDETITTGYGGLLISNFPNEEKTITVSKEGYKTATATIILDAEKQTHKFFLALETDDDESEVISTDDTQPQEDEFNKCGTLFELSDNNTLIIWNQYKTNEISEGVYTGSGSYIKQGWSNEGLWQLDYDIKYNTTKSSYQNYYVGVMPFCSEEINPYTNEKRKNYCMESWEKWAAIEGMDAICIEGPANYKYLNQDEYHHATVKKIAKNKIEYYFDDKKWIFSVPKLQNLETLHFGYRDNPSDRRTGVTISTKNIKVVGLCSEPVELNDTVQVDEIYEFKSFGDEEGETEWGEGTVQIKSLPENEDDLYIEVEVKTNSPDDSFVGQTFYILKNAAVGNEIYPLYSDELGTETGIYVIIKEKIEPETEPETPEDSPCLILEFNGDSFSTSTANPFNYTNDIVIDWGDETIETYTGGELTHNYSESNNYIIKITGNITELKSTCFYDCTGLTSIDIPSSVTSLGDSCFGRCTGLTSINIPSSVTSFGDSCFHSCTSLTSINIPSNVTSIGSSCFNNCTGLTSIDIPSSITSIGVSCFSYCTGLTSINIPSSITSLGNACFNNCTSLTSIDIPSSITSLGDSCFSGCTSLTSIDIPSSVTSLGSNCFINCTGLTSINIPSSITSIRDYCFKDCNLTSVNLNWTTSTTIITYNNSWFRGSSNHQFIIPTNTTDLYINKSYPSDKITTIE